MFSRKHQLLAKTGPDGIGRYDFLRLLKKEFMETSNVASKDQTLANLANFAYDPINYDYIRSLQLMDLFLEQLISDNELHVRFSIAALCNLSADPSNADIILKKNGVPLISKHLYSQDNEVVLNTLSTLLYLHYEPRDNQVLSPIILEKVKTFQSSKNQRLVNLATIFLYNKLYATSSNKNV